MAKRCGPRPSVAIGYVLITVRDVGAPARRDAERGLNLFGVGKSPSFVHLLGCNIDSRDSAAAVRGRVQSRPCRFPDPVRAAQRCQSQALEADRRTRQAVRGGIPHNRSAWRPNRLRYRDL